MAMECASVAAAASKRPSLESRERDLQEGPAGLAQVHNELLLAAAPGGRFYQRLKGILGSFFPGGSQGRFLSRSAFHDSQYYTCRYGT